MARYKAPPDPRKPDSELPPRRKRWQRQDSREPIPWLWLGLGVAVTILAIGLSFYLANLFLTPPPLPEGPPAPTVIVLTAPPSPLPTETAVLPTPTIPPTFTPILTPDTAVAPPEVTVGFYATVANTDGVGVTIRGGPSVSNVALTIAAEESVVLVLDGPTESDGFLWWQVQLDDGTEGWAAGDFLEPAAAP